MLVRSSLALGFCALLLVAWSAQILDWKRVPGASRWASLKSLTVQRDDQLAIESSAVPRSTLRAFTDTVGAHGTVFGTVADIVQVEVDGAAALTRIVFVEGDYFGAVGVTLRLGKTPFPTTSETVARDVVVSEDFWRQRLGADPNVLGRAIRVASRSMTGEEWAEFTVVGVATGPFAGLEAGAKEALWMPWSAWPDVLLPAIESNERMGDIHFPLRAGVALRSAADIAPVEAAAAQAILPGVSASVRHTRLALLDGFGIDPQMRSAFSEQSRLYRSAAIALCAMLGTGYLLWLRLQQTRMGTEAVVRAVLGETASRRLRRELRGNAVRVVPSLVAGAVLAVVVLHLAAKSDALAGLRGVVEQFTSNLSYVELLGWVVVSGALLSFGGVGGATLMGRAPATLGSARLVHQRQSRLPLFAGFVCLAVISGLALSEMQALQRIVTADLGFRTEGQHVLNIVPVDPQHPEWFRYVSKADVRPLEEALTAALQMDPRVRAVSLSSSAPLDEPQRARVKLTDPAGGPDIEQAVYSNEVGPNYAAQFGLHLSQGRWPHEDAQDEVTVSETFVRHVLSGFPDPLDARFSLTAPGASDAAVVRVVGVVSSPFRISAASAAVPVVYQPLRHTSAAWSINIEASQDSMSLAAATARRVFAQFSSANWTLSPPQSLSVRVQREREPDRARAASIGAIFVATLLFGALAFVSSMRQWLIERGTEMAVRRALGASRLSLAQAAMGIGPVMFAGMAVMSFLAAMAVSRWVKPVLPLQDAALAAVGATAIMLATVALCIGFAVSKRQERALMSRLNG